MDCKYERGKIYKITNSATNKIYIGSTTEPLRTRLSKHKYTAKKGQTSSKELFNEDGITKIELIKNCPCESKWELELEESKAIKENSDIVVNKRIPSGVAGKTYICGVCNLELTVRNRMRHNNGSVHRKNLNETSESDLSD